MITWIKKNRLEFFSIFVILVLAAFLRLYHIDQYMTFLGDEGRDALVIKKILVEGDFPLLGPPTSVGNMYLGPLYYYMMLIPMTIFWLNPLAAAVQVAVIGVATIGLIFYLMKSWFGLFPAILASFLYAVSPITTYYSRSSWNPNPAPFFSLLAILGFYKARKTRNFKWFILTGVSLAFVVQMHYLALILLPVFFILWLYEFLLLKRGKMKINNFVYGTVGAILAFLILMSPLVIFDFKYNFMNYQALQTFFSNRETTVNLNPLNTLQRLPQIYSYSLVGRHIAAENPFMTIFVSLLILIPLIYSVVLKFTKKEPFRWVYLTLGLYLFVGILGLMLYKQNIYDHYIGFLNPLPYLLLGGFLSLFKNKSQLLIGGLLLIILGFLNLQKSPIFYPPNNQLYRTQEISKFVISESKNKPFNFALISKSNYDAAYQFYLDIYNHKPKQLPFEKTDQLFVVCEDSDCQPVGHPKYEIAAFGWSKIENVQNFAGVKVYKLIPNEEENTAN